MYTLFKNIIKSYTETTIFPQELKQNIELIWYNKTVTYYQFIRNGFLFHFTIVKITTRISPSWIWGNWLYYIWKKSKNRTRLTFTFKTSQNLYFNNCFLHFLHLLIRLCGFSPLILIQQNCCNSKQKVHFHFYYIIPYSKTMRAKRVLDNLKRFTGRFSYATQSATTLN